MSWFVSQLVRQIVRHSTGSTSSVAARAVAVAADGLSSGRVCTLEPLVFSFPLLTSRIWAAYGVATPTGEE